MKTTLTTPLRTRRRRGAAVMEMALVSPVLFALILGGVEYGYAFYLKNTMQGAAREAARVAITPTATAADVRTAADGVVGAAMPGILAAAGYDVTVSPSNPAVAEGEWVTVTVKCKWSDSGVSALPRAMGGINPSRVISSTAVMRKE